MVDKLSQSDLDERIASMHGWTVEEGKLRKDYSFDDFEGALAFVNEVGRIAEEANHHPEIRFTYGKATIELVTHDASGITEKDFALARAIDRS